MGTSVREYVDADWQMVSDWWNAHPAGDRVLSKAMLPPVGVIVERDGEPQCALWVHLSVNCGVAFLDYPVALPGIGLKRTGDVFGVAIEVISAICKKHDYGMLIANTLPGIARWLERKAGFQRTGDRVQVAKLIYGN